MKKVRIIIRTLNEGKWLDLCLRSLKRQSYSNFEIIGIDSGSTDLTLKIFKKHKISVVRISDYKPGAAINFGLEKNGGYDYGIILSAHCIPLNNTWMKTFINFMENNPSVAGAYGKQHPMNFTNDENTRDLVMTFRDETSVNRSMFFHNANSIIRGSVISKYPFDNEIKHIEDIVWARDILNAGFDLGYVKEAGVTHFHGTNQHKTNYFSLRGRELNNVFSSEELTQKISLFELFDNSELQFQTICFASDCKCPFEKSVSVKRQYPHTENLSLWELLRKIALDCYLSKENLVGLRLIRDCSNYSKNLEWKTEFIDKYPDAIIPVTSDHGNYWIDDGININRIQGGLQKRTEKRKILREDLMHGSVIHLNAFWSYSGLLEDSILKEI